MYLHEPFTRKLYYQWSPEGSEDSIDPSSFTINLYHLRARVRGMVVSINCSLLMIFRRLYALRGLILQSLTHQSVECHTGCIQMRSQVLRLVETVIIPTITLPITNIAQIVNSDRSLFPT